MCTRHPLHSSRDCEKKMQPLACFRERQGGGAAVVDADVAGHGLVVLPFGDQTAVRPLEQHVRLACHCVAAMERCRLTFWNSSASSNDLCSE